MHVSYLFENQNQKKKNNEQLQPKLENISKIDLSNGNAFKLAERLVQTVNKILNNWTSSKNEMKI